MRGERFYFIADNDKQSANRRSRALHTMDGLGSFLHVDCVFNSPPGRALDSHHVIYFAYGVFRDRSRASLSAFIQGRRAALFNNGGPTSCNGGPVLRAQNHDP